MNFKNLFFKEFSIFNSIRFHTWNHMAPYNSIHGTILFESVSSIPPVVFSLCSILFTEQPLSAEVLDRLFTLDDKFPEDFSLAELSVT